MPKHKIEKEAPNDYRVPENIPAIPKAATILVDFPWSKGQGGHFGAIEKYDLMSMDRILKFPLKDLAADNCTLWLWTTNSCLPDALKVINEQGFTYRGYYVWCKAKLGLGSQYLRQCTELCVVATRGKVKFNNHSQMNWGIMPTTIHSEKPREFIPIIERLCDPPYMDLFCCKRPSSNQKWLCWGSETEGGADFFIPGYPVPNIPLKKKTQTRRRCKCMRRKDDKENHTDRGLLSRIVEGVIIFAILAFALKLGVDAIVSVKIPLLIIAIIICAAVIGYRVYRNKRDHDDY